MTFGLTLLDAWIAAFDEADDSAKREIAARLQPYLASEQAVAVDVHLRNWVVSAACNAVGIMRTAGHKTAEGRRWYSRLIRARRAVELAEGRRDELAREALQAGVGARGVGQALGIDKGTVSRRYGRGRK